MLIICAWCRKTIGHKRPYKDRRKTHGICKVCAEALRKEYKLLVPKPTETTE